MRSGIDDAAQCKRPGISVVFVAGLRKVCFLLPVQLKTRMKWRGTQVMLCWSTRAKEQLYLSYSREELCTGYDWLYPFKVYSGNTEELLNQWG